MFHPRYPWEFPDPSFPFSIQESPRHGDFPLHRHGFIEIVYIMAGQGVHTLDTDVSTLAAGDCFVIPIDCVHGYAETAGLHLVNILFDARLLAPFHRELHALPGYHALFTLEPIYRRQHDSRGRLRPTVRERMAIAELITQMLAESRHEAPGYRLKLLALFVQLLTDLSRYYQETQGKSPAQLVQIGTVISQVEADLAYPYTIRELADIACMSPRNLARRFQESVGMSPIDYLNHRRIQRAAQWLRDSNRPIAEIACAVGIDNSNYFSRQFKRHFGVSPREYRRQDTAG